MKITFTEKNQKFNNKTLFIISSTHEGKLFHAQKDTFSHIETIDVDFMPYPDKHGQLTKSSPSGNLQKAGMVYERDNEEEISEYIENISLKAQEYISHNDENILRLVVTAPASIHKELEEKLMDTLHNVHLKDVYLVDANYIKNTLGDIISILDKKDFEELLLTKNIK